MNIRHYHLLGRIAIAVASVVCSHVSASPTIPVKPNLLSAQPIYEIKEGVVVSKIADLVKTDYIYEAGALKSIANSTSRFSEYSYLRNGQLDRIILSNGVVQTARYNENGELYAILSSTGNALQINGTGTARRATKVAAVDVNHFAETPIKTAKTKQTQPSDQALATPDSSLATFLRSVDGWDDDGATVNSGCGDDKDEQTGIGGGEAIARRAIASKATESEEPPTTNCVIVVVPGTGGGEGGGIGGIDYPGGEPGAGGGGSGGTGPSEPPLPPGAGHGDTPFQKLCTAAAYKSWLEMEAKCDKAPVNERPVCREVNMRLYVKELDYCRANP